jgi:hypothetical protein
LQRIYDIHFVAEDLDLAVTAMDRRDARRVLKSVDLNVKRQTLGASNKNVTSQLIVEAL